MRPRLPEITSRPRRRPPRRAPCCIWLLALLVALGPCAARAGAPNGDPREPSVAALVAAVQADAERSEHASRSSERARLAADASDTSQACLARAPRTAPCHYARALALGLLAQAHPLHALSLLKQMLEQLARAEAGDPDFDEAGPARVRALVLIRAPGWPLGPGNAALGLAAAERAVALHPEFPPNWLALAEAQTKNGARAQARESYARARERALEAPASVDRTEWLEQADEALRTR